MTFPIEYNAFNQFYCIFAMLYGYKDIKRNPQFVYDAKEQFRSTGQPLFTDWGVLL